MREEDDGFFRMVDGLAREVGLIVDDQRDDVVPGMSSAVTTMNSSQGTPGSKSMPRMMPRGEGLRTVMPCSMPGSVEVVDVARLAGDFARGLPCAEWTRRSTGIRRGLCMGLPASVRGRVVRARRAPARAG